MLKKASHFNDENRVYDYLILQSGSFGGKALWSDNNKWHHHGFRDYWMPTETSVRRSPCNPTHPEPSVMYERLKNIVDVCGGNIRALHMDVRDFIKREVFGTNSIIYIDPEYKGTTGYKTDLNKLDVIKDVVYMLASGADPDDVIPYDLTGMSPDCIIEICALYISHGKDEGRKEICRNMIYAARTNGGL